MARALPKYRPYASSNAQFQIGLRPSDPAAWIDIGDDHVDFMRAKRQRLRHTGDAHYRSLPESIPAQRELLDLLAGHVTRHLPDAFTRDGGAIVDRLDGTRHGSGDGDGEPLSRVGEIAEEDFILLQDLGGGYILTAASNAYSTSGRIVASVGHAMPFAHELVPGLNTQLDGRIARVIANIKPETPVERFNWTLTSIGNRLFPHQSPHAANEQASDAVAVRLAADPGRAGDLLWLRAERQIFVRLPETKALAFSLYTYSDPLSSIADDRESLTGLARLLETYEESRLRYSAMLSLKEPVLAWIASRLS